MRCAPMRYVNLHLHYINLHFTFYSLKQDVPLHLKPSSVALELILTLIATADSSGKGKVDHAPQESVGGWVLITLFQVLNP